MQAMIHTETAGTVFVLLMVAKDNAFRVCISVLRKSPGREFGEMVVNVMMTMPGSPRFLRSRVLLFF